MNRAAPLSRKFRFAISGTHLTGKTTLCHDVVARLLRRGYAVSLALEPSRISRYLAGGSRGHMTQLELFAGTIAAEVEALRSAEIVICDRSLLDVLAYTDALSIDLSRHKEVLAQAMSAFSELYIPTYDMIFRPAWRFSMVDSVDPLREEGDALQEYIDQRICHHAERIGVGLINLGDPNSAAAEIEDRVISIVELAAK
ncbi:AAA family ATPase [Umezawaea tangerina]|uniref:AAA family ATPase n=1 Tax=Umezawaea tangerina TaxID=84725 RepID=UPI000D06EA40|nr:AAA family ATPase [Umezawaea tangerina]